MEFYEARATINSAPPIVWQTLIEVSRWPSWDSGVLSVEGSMAPGSKLTIRAAVGGDRAFPVKVTAFEPPHRLVFSGGMPLGLFRGVRTYTLTGEGDSTLFVMREEYSGALLKSIWKSIPDLGPSFAQFAEGLKKEVEGGA